MPPGAHVKVNGGGKALVCKECGLQMAQPSFKRLELPRQCGFCETPMDEPGEPPIWMGPWTQRLEEEHWGWKQLWCDMLKEVAVGDVEGQLEGAMMDYLEKNVQALEEDLTEIRDCAVTHQLASMTAGQHLEEKEGSDDRLGVHAVLQTYTVPLAQVRRELKDWIPSLEYEVNSLEKTTRAVRPISRFKTLRRSRATTRCWWSPPNWFPQ